MPKKATTKDDERKIEMPKTKRQKRERNKNTQIRNEKNRMQKDGEASKQKRAQRFIKIALPSRWHGKTRFKRLFLLR